MQEKSVDQPFVYRSYTKDELAQMYLPGNARITAVRKFNAWLKKSPQLQEQLQHSGADLYTRVYTTAQVRKIIDHLGEP